LVCEKLKLSISTRKGCLVLNAAAVGGGAAAAEPLHYIRGHNVLIKAIHKSIVKPPSSPREASYYASFCESKVFCGKKGTKHGNLGTFLQLL
jgi:hypothetical protein